MPQKVHKTQSKTPATHQDTIIDSMPKNNLSLTPMRKINKNTFFDEKNTLTPEEFFTPLRAKLKSNAEVWNEKKIYYLVNPRKNEAKKRKITFTRKISDKEFNAKKNNFHQELLFLSTHEISQAKSRYAFIPKNNLIKLRELLKKNTQYLDVTHITILLTTLSKIEEGNSKYLIESITNLVLEKLLTYLTPSGKNKDINTKDIFYILRALPFLSICHKDYKELYKQLVDYLFFQCEMFPFNLTRKILILNILIQLKFQFINKDKLEKLTKIFLNDLTRENVIALKPEIKSKFWEFMIIYNHHFNDDFLNHLFEPLDMAVKSKGNRCNANPSELQLFCYTAMKNLLSKNNKNAISLEYQVGPYSMDIAFPQFKINIEIDGAHHERLSTLRPPDTLRDCILREHEGWHIIRINENKDPFGHFNPIEQNKSDILQKLYKIFRTTKIADLLSHDTLAAIKKEPPAIVPLQKKNCSPKKINKKRHVKIECYTTFVGLFDSVKNQQPSDSFVEKVSISKNIISFEKLVIDSKKRSKARSNVNAKTSTKVMRSPHAKKLYSDVVKQESLIPFTKAVKSAPQAIIKQNPNQKADTVSHKPHRESKNDKKLKTQQKVTSVQTFFVPCQTPSNESKTPVARLNTPPAPMRRGLVVLPSILKTPQKMSP
ncbi:MAG: hypothetical protein K2Q14_08145 [Gammaproteobacteria bacterium]|nr:hypothetical protein [Gammaproteobacteria bacterium]